MAELFHAYVIGGDRDSAKAHVDSVRLDQGVSEYDFSVTECVSFGIDEARALSAWLALAPSGERKIGAVYADFITREAENALLKTFEEPTPGTYIFLAIPNPDALLPTLLSRVQVIRLESDSTPGIAAAKKFLNQSIPERIATVAKIAEKGDDEEAAAEVRERTRAFMDALETVLAEDPEKNVEKLTTLLSLKKYLYMSGASSKMLLETIALTF